MLRGIFYHLRISAESGWTQGLCYYQQLLLATWIAGHMAKRQSESERKLAFWSNYLCPSISLRCISVVKYVCRTYITHKYIYIASLWAAVLSCLCVQGDILSRLRQAWMTSKPGFCWHHFASISRPLPFLTARLR